MFAAPPGHIAAAGRGQNPDVRLGRRAPAAVSATDSAGTRRSRPSALPHPAPPPRGVPLGGTGGERLPGARAKLGARGPAAAVVPGGAREAGPRAPSQHWAVPAGNIQAKAPPGTHPAGVKHLPFYTSVTSEVLY